MKGHLYILFLFFLPAITKAQFAVDDTLCVENTSGDQVFNVYENDIQVDANEFEVTIQVPQVEKLAESPFNAINNDNGEFVFYQDRNWPFNSTDGYTEAGTIVSASYYIQFRSKTGGIDPENSSANIYFVYSDDCDNFIGITDPANDIELEDDYVCIAQRDNNVLSLLGNDLLNIDQNQSFDLSILIEPVFGSLSNVPTELTSSSLPTINYNYENTPMGVDSFLYKISNTVTGEEDVATVYINTNTYTLTDTTYIVCDSEIQLSKRDSWSSGKWLYNSSKVILDENDPNTLVTVNSFPVELSWEDDVFTCANDLKVTVEKETDNISWNGNANSGKFCKTDGPIYLFDLITGYGSDSGVWTIDGEELGDTLYTFDLDYGNHIIEFDSDLLKCSIFSDQIEIKGELTDLSGLEDTYCSIDSIIDLSSLSNGNSDTWKINDVETSDFSLSQEKVDTITRLFKNEGCDDSLSKIVTIYPLPIISLNSLEDHYCSNLEELELTSLSNSITDWKVNGVDKSLIMFDDYNEDTLTVTGFATTQYCRDSVFKDIVIQDPELANLDFLKDSYCTNNDSIDLDLTSEWKLNDISIQTIDFDTITTNVINVTRIVSNNVCTDSISKQITIEEPLLSTLDLLEERYCSNEIGINLDTLYIDNNDEWKIDGVINSSLTFNDLEMNVTRIVSTAICTDSLSKKVIIQTPVLSTLDLLEDIYCANEEALNLSELYNDTSRYLLNGMLGDELRFNNYTDSVYVQRIVSDSVCTDTSFKILVVRDSLNAMWDQLNGSYCSTDSLILSDFISSDLDLVAQEWRLGEIVLNDTIVLMNYSGDSLEIIRELSDEFCTSSYSQSIYIDEFINADWKVFDKTEYFCRLDPALDLLSLQNNQNGDWYLYHFNSDLTTSLDSSLSFENLVVNNNYQLTYELNNGVCSDTSSSLFVVLNEPSYSLGLFEDQICKYAGELNLDTLFDVTSSSIHAEHVWKFDDSIVGPIIDVFDYQEGIYDFTYSIKNSVCSIDTIVSITISDFKDEQFFIDSICNDTMIYVNELQEKYTSKWIELSDLLITEIGDTSILFNSNYLTASAKYVVLDSFYKCVKVENYTINYVEVADSTSIIKNSEVDLFDDFDFELEASVVPYGYKGEWVFDETKINIESPFQNITEGNVLVTDTIDVIWELNSNICPSFSETVQINKNKYIVSEGFSPNDDGLNDYFEILGTPPGDISLTIINRWGQIIYSNKRYRNDWNGRTKQGRPFPNDTYYYTIVFENGDQDKGVFVIRK